MVLKGKVFVTGGSGFLARAIYRRAESENWDCEFTCYSRDEEKQAHIAREFDNVRCILGDVRDLHHLTGHVWGHDTIIHAAAVKFVPEAERNVLEAIKVNIDGARNIIRVAGRQGVKRVIGISTDKACLPVNVYGTTKMLLERSFAEANRMGLTTRFVTVRYGNVVGSTGSIVPLFRRQMKERKRVTVTNPDATRFWLSVDAAVNLILFALGNIEDHPGGVFVSECPSMKIGDLARLIAGEAPVDIIGMRPGEKAHETLIHRMESPRTEWLEDYVVVSPATVSGRGEVWEYTSDKPKAWVTNEEMLQMIEVAATI